MKNQVPVLKALDPTHVAFEEKVYLFFGGYDYHRLSWHPDIADALNHAARTYGLNSGGSRCTTGNHPLHLKLEKALAQFFKCEDALLFPTGYLANLAFFESFKKQIDVLYIDEKSHPSLKNGAYISGLETRIYPHMDAKYIENDVKNLPKDKKRFLIVTEGTWSVYSTIVPADRYMDIAEKYNGMLLVDEAHTAGVLGKTGRGIREHFCLSSERYLISGTLSKAFGTYGGFLVGSKHWIEPVRNSSHVFHGSSAFPLPLCAAGLKALEIIDHSADRVQKLQKTSLEVKQHLQEQGFHIPLSPTPIISILFDHLDHVEKMKSLLIKSGIYPSYIFYPGGPTEGYFRFALSSAHSEEEIQTFLTSLSQYI
ncbi:MAG: pyridoxal phosphate-dependent aminotransferase family protein [Candidatus Marinimicrobia bacterium]|nr:pyridoxal phosphate-dependent aminotransferase family protein [Candidatus Neomarinimicrobiota bacterium]